MSQYPIINENTGLPDFFGATGASMTISNQPNVNIGAAKGLGITDHDLLSNIPLSSVGEGCGSVIVENTGQYGTYRACVTSADGSAFAPGQYGSNEVLWKGNSQGLGAYSNNIDCTGERFQPANSAKFDYSDGTNEAMSHGFWNPVSGCWTCGFPVCDVTTLNAPVDTGLTYCIGAPNPIVGTHES